MKKYFLLMVVLSAGSYLQAADVMQFATVLSKPVGSFMELGTTSCAYPDVKGSGTDYSQQAVVNFGYPTGPGGTITLYGGPVQIDSLLLEDDTTTTSEGVWMFDTNTTDPDNKGLLLYPSANLTVGRIFMNTLLLAHKNKNGTEYSEHEITVQNRLTINWSSLTVKNLTVKEKIADLTVVGSDSFGSASFKSIPQTPAEQSAGHTVESGWTYLAR